MFFSQFLSRRRRDNAAAALYLTVVEQARLPDFYATLGVPDTLEGRYDMIILHAWLLMRRLGLIQPETEAKEVAQAVFDRMFADMDRNLREMGVTDLRVGKRVQKMSEAFYGRVVAYDQGLEQGGDALAAALARNLYHEVDAPDPAHLDALIHYIKGQMTYLNGQSEKAVLSGTVSFTAPEVGR